jgi:hypothetical protein
VTLRIGDATLRAPANMDRVGPWWAIGEVDARGGPIRLELAVDDAPLHSSNQVAEITGLAAAPTEPELRLVPLSEACDRYVDWYVLGPERPRVPAARASG